MVQRPFQRKDKTIFRHGRGARQRQRRTERTEKQTLRRKTQEAAQTDAKPSSSTEALEQQRTFCRTSEMSHDRGRRAACRTTIPIPWFHFENPSVARGVTAMVVGSG